MGDELEEITGVVTYAFGFYRILPLTAIQIVTPADPAVSPTSLVSRGTCKGITIGDYNTDVETRCLRNVGCGGGLRDAG